MKRSQKKLEKLKKNFDRRRELYHLMKQYGDDIMRSDNLLANLYHPAAYEWDWLNCYAIYKKRTQSFKRIEFFG